MRKVGLRAITRANKYRQRALLRCQYKTAIHLGTAEYEDIAFLYEENIKEWDRSVLAFENDNEEFMVMKVRTRFNDKKRVLMKLVKDRKGLKNAFRKYKDAVMITLTVPHIFPLVVPLKDKGRIIGFIPLQDSIITQLKKNMLAWIRKNWKGKEIKTFTAYEYHGDYILHIHILVFGIPYLINWSRKYGRRGEDALTYYSRKCNIPLPNKENKTLISKYVFTALLDMWLQRILIRLGSILKMNLLEVYVNYEKKQNLQGPINEIHRIKKGKWWANHRKTQLENIQAGRRIEMLPHQMNTF
ncbi:hypothetical protein [Saccharolobus shibatae]|uniref:Rolling circle replication initiation endonuclease, HUH superfamily n=1 Tax=Saccharolobus shibatae TaxID=2286 RepID=A0A8F5BZ71_9CREN|nr:hypothetical protein [Saccharolobus shibatae]QXJ34174.1 Rolling circle replication initiation endonuclease, HUH superfamily [Saccharolobus shibatae]